MIEVDSLRRNYNFGHYDPNFAMGAHNPFAHGTLGTAAPIPESHRALIHWNQPTEPAPQPTSRDTAKSGSRSDEEDDDEDEDRPFTPPPPRERLSYTRYQLELLNGIYNEVRYPNSTQKQLIAKRVGITREQVKIWFQNRRRKDVVGNSGKSKSCDTSTSSNGSHDSGHPSPKSDEMDSVASDDNISVRHDSPEPAKDGEETVVPSVVMKSIIGELHKFLNDPCKGRKKKDKKRAKVKQKEKANKVKKGLASTLLAGNYDMVSPPNQIVPQAFFDKVKTGFNHSKVSSAFANPRENKQPTQISSISTTSESCPPDMTSRERSQASALNNKSAAVPSFSGVTSFPFPGQHGQRPPMFQNHPGFSPQNNINGCEIPVLSDLMAYSRSPVGNNRKKAPPPTTSLPSSLPPQQSTGSGSQNNFHALNSHAMNNFNSGRPLNGIFPYPFLAEHNVFMSSLRQPEHILRPSPHYPPAHYSDDPYQPLLISSFSNPFFTTTPSSWASAGLPNPPTSAYAPR